MKQIFSVFVLALLAGCSSVEVFSLGDPIDTVAAAETDQPLTVYRTRRQIAQPYREFALLRSDASDPDQAAAELVEAARKLGGRAVVLEPFNRELHLRETTYLPADADERKRLRWKGFIRQPKGPFWATVLKQTDAQPGRSIASETDAPVSTAKPAKNP